MFRWVLAGPDPEAREERARAIQTICAVDKNVHPGPALVQAANALVEFAAAKIREVLTPVST